MADTEDTKLSHVFNRVTGLEALQAELLMVGLIHTVLMHKYLTLLHSTYEHCL